MRAGVGCALLACLAVLALIPGKAVAIKCAPPGISGVNQYYETVPGGSCDVPPPGCHLARARRRDLTPADVRHLRSEGAVGRAIIQSVTSYAPRIPRSRGSMAPTEGGGENPVAALGRLMLTGSSTRTEPGAVASGCPKSSGSTGAGLLLPLLLAAALAGAVAAFLERRRRAEPSWA